jgi:hypothetical protein
MQVVDAFPLLKYCVPKFMYRTPKDKAKYGDDFWEDVEKLKYHRKANINDKDAIMSNPLMSFGSGIILYTKLMFNTSVVFFVLTILAMPLMFMYVRGTEFR